MTDFSIVNFSDDFWITFVTNTAAQAGQQVCLTVKVEANAGVDNNPLNDNLTHCFNVVNSFDPNDKQVYPKYVDQPGGWHTYTVRFQNTGTAPAIHIIVKDTLDQNLDWSSFQLLSYSHNNLTQVFQDNVVHFNFPNIYLPDSNSNEPESHGYIQYRIKTNSSITPGTVIHNTAAIYFDFNDPVITNDAVVTYCTPIETQQSIDICNGDSVLVGTNWIHQPGIYTHLFTNAVGCDSTLITTVSIAPTNFDIAVTDNVLSTSGGVAYQWFDCITGQPVDGETNAVFTALQNGNYRAFITDINGCEGFTDCANVTSIGMSSFHQGIFSLEPNPASSRVCVHHARSLVNASLVITDVAGRVSYSRQLDATTEQTHVELSEFADGVYNVHVEQNGKRVFTQKLMLTR